MNKPLLSLVLIALTCGLLLSATHALTRAQTTANRQAFELEKLREVAGNVGWHIELMGSDAQGDEYYRLSDNNGPTGYVYRAETTAGYNGLIQLIMAVDLQGRVLGVRVTRHQETPGLGDKIEPQLSDWIHRFEGRSLEDPEVAGWTVRKNGGDFDQFTGATITPRAVVHAVRDRLLALQKQADISGAPQ